MVSFPSLMHWAQLGRTAEKHWYQKQGYFSLLRNLLTASGNLSKQLSTWSSSSDWYRFIKFSWVSQLNCLFPLKFTSIYKAPSTTRTGSQPPGLWCLFGVLLLGNIFLSRTGTTENCDVMASVMNICLRMGTVCSMLLLCFPHVLVCLLPCFVVLYRKEDLQRSWIQEKENNENKVLENRSHSHGHTG